MVAAITIHINIITTNIIVLILSIYSWLKIIAILR